MEPADDIRAALDTWANQRLGMSLDDVLVAIAMLNGTQTISDVHPRTMLYWSAFFIELARLQFIIAKGMRQLLANT